MKIFHKIWKWLTSFEDTHELIPTINNILKLLVWIGVITLFLSYIHYMFAKDFDKDPETGQYLTYHELKNKAAWSVVSALLVGVGIGVFVSHIYRDNKKEEESQKKLTVEKNKEYLKNNIKISDSKIRPDELTNERTFYLYVTIKNMGEEIVYHLDLQLKLYDKDGYWFEKRELAIPDHIAPREEREFKIALLQEKYPYPRMSQFKELKIKPLVCNIFKAENCNT